MAFDYDLFVIGAGSGGLAASKCAATYGARIAIAEQHRIGGTCLNRGCIPKKLMVYASGFAYSFEDAPNYGWSKIQSGFDWQRFIVAKDQALRQLRESHTRSLKQAGVDLIEGHATFVDAHTLDVEGRRITADKILLAVGGQPIKPNVPGMEHAITSRDMFYLEQRPQRLAIIGGGYIGLEFSGIMHGLGTDVTLMERGESILSGFDQDVCHAVQAGMTQRGIQILCGTETKSIEPTAEGLKVTMSGNYEQTIVVDAVLCAIGRKPNLENLGLEKVGVETTDKGAIAVNEYSCTTQENIFAIGDCSGRMELTPVAIAEGKAFANTVFGNNPSQLNYNLVPFSVFSRPQAAAVGLSEAAAREKFGESVKCYCTNFNPLYYHFVDQEEKALLKLVVDSNSDQVLGVHMVGEHAAEAIQGMAIALNLGVTKKDFDATVGIHPTTTEEIFSL